MPEGRSSISNSRTKLAILLRMNRCGSFPLLSAPHSLFIIWTDLKRSEKIPGAPAWRWGEWILLTGPSGLHGNSPQGLNNSSIGVFDQIRDPEIPITSPSRPPIYSRRLKYLNSICFNSFLNLYVTLITLCSIVGLVLGYLIRDWILCRIYNVGAKSDWDFWISDLAKHPNGTSI